MFFTILVLKNFAKFTGKHICWSLALMKVQAARHANVFKRDSSIGAFL